MKVSYNWLQELIDFKLPAIDELVEKIGTQLGGIEEVINIGERYQGITVVKVMECKPIEGSDHLNVCRIDDGNAVKDVERGDDGLVQVVCGAPNCREGLLVAWLPPGCTVPSSLDEDEPFVLGARELRGVKSNGMLASPKELGLYDSHDYILELNAPDAKSGDDFAKTYGLAGEYIIEIENKMFTHRPDCFGLLGVAREVAGILDKPFHSPKWYVDGQADLFAKVSNSLPVKVTNELPEQVPRFVALSVAGVTTALPSLPWMATKLSLVGVKPINLIVDLTNYFMMLTGQPMHAYDYDKVKALSGGDSAHLVVRAPHDAEKLEVIGGKTVTLRDGDIVIASDKAAIGLGGVMGGANSNIDDQTTNIILESATFDMYAIRRTAMAHGLFTDAVTRFNKGQSPLQNDRALAEAARSLVEYTDKQAELGSLVDDIHLSDREVKSRSLHPPVKLDVGFINQRLGSELTVAEVKKLLQHVECEVETNGDELTIAAPFWRTDIELREDIVEEVGRLHGYDHLPLELPKRDITPAERDALLNAKDQIRERLAKSGANEVLTYSFVHADLLKNVGQDPAKAFELSNALSPDLQYYRLSLMPSLLDKVHMNLKAGYDEFALFEIGKVHNIDNPDDGEGVPIEFELTALVITANDKLKKSGTAYYAAQQYIRQFFGEHQVGFAPVDSDHQKYELSKLYDPARSARIDTPNGPIGIVGEFNPSVRRALKLPRYSAGFEIDTAALGQALDENNDYQPLSRFPKVTQDMTLKVEAKTTYAQLEDFMIQTCSQLGKDKVHISFVPLMSFQSEDDTAHHNVSFRYSFVNFERTMTDKEVNAVLDELAAEAKTKLGAERL